MAHVFTFRSAKFDVAAETPNPINPIAGESVLLWLREQLRDSPYSATTPEAEDWGWYVNVSGAGASYLVGASAEADAPAAAVEWTLQIDRHRSFTDKLKGANKMSDDDPVSGLFERILRSEPAVMQLELDKGD